MARARGANAKLALAFESTYGVPPASGFLQMPFASSELGEEQDLIASDLLGQGRDPAAPALDVINDDGDMVVPVDLRAFGQWLKLHFGAPTTTQGVAASGTVTFSDIPADGGNITIGGAEWTFVASGASGDESLIAATLRDTLAAAVQGLNTSATTALLAQHYDLNADGTVITITSKAIGTSGNSVTLASSTSPASHGTVSGADLAGGSASGPYNHVFASGALALPTASAEIANPDVPSFVMNYGVMSDKIAISLSRSGLLNATVSLIAQGEKPRTPTTSAGSPSAILLERFTQRTGRISRLGVALSETVSGNFSCMNGTEKAENIREDGRIDGGDPGEASYTGQAVIRFKDTQLLDLAGNGTPLDVTYGWKIAAGKALSFLFHEVYLPKPKVPITGPSGIQATFDWQGAKNATAGRALTVTLVNDVASYA